MPNESHHSIIFHILFNIFHPLLLKLLPRDLYRNTEQIKCVRKYYKFQNICGGDGNLVHCFRVTFSRLLSCCHPLYLPQFEPGVAAAGRCVWPSTGALQIRLSHSIKHALGLSTHQHTTQLPRQGGVGTLGNPTSLLCILFLPKLIEFCVFSRYYQIPQTYFLHVSDKQIIQLIANTAHHITALDTSGPSQQQLHRPVCPICRAEHGLHSVWY